MIRLAQVRDIARLEGIRYALDALIPHILKPVDGGCAAEGGEGLNDGVHPRYRGLAPLTIRTRFSHWRPTLREGYRISCGVRSGYHLGPIIGPGIPRNSHRAGDLPAQSEHASLKRCWMTTASTARRRLGPEPNALVASEFVRGLD